MGDPITVNIGGELHVACRSTLQKAPFFAVLMDHMDNGTLNTTKDSVGRIYVDRVGTHFRYVLSYLRSEHLPTFRDSSERDQVADEFRFYGINQKLSVIKEQTEVVSMISETFKEEHGSVTVEEHGRVRVVSNNVVIEHLRGEVEGGRKRKRLSGNSGKPFSQLIWEKEDLLPELLIFEACVDVHLGKLGFKIQPDEAVKGPTRKKLYRKVVTVADTECDNDDDGGFVIEGAAS